MKKVFETDWLASQPVFYNELTGQVSDNVNNVIDFSNFEFHPEGFNNYLDFGYSVLEQTPIKHVKFLRHSSRLIVDDDGKFEVQYLEDPVKQWIGKTSHEDDVFQVLYTTVQNWEKLVEGEIIIPTSGGYDSRLLNLLIQDKSRIRSFTYGVSQNQAKSFEVVNAKKISEILGTKWEHIVLGDYHRYFDDWDKIFGVSTHAHGMYHIEFYQKILPKIQGNNPLLSGIIGDVWAGLNINQITSYLEVLILGYNHGLKADSTMSLLKSNQWMIKQYYNYNQDLLKIPIVKVIEAMRFKIILLSYLMTIPKSFGFKPWSPFLIPEIALSMLTLPSKRREKRLWQKEFFQKHGLDLESMNLKASRQNNLNHQAMRFIPVKPLDVNLLREAVLPQYVEWINHYVSPKLTLWDLVWSLHKVPKVRKIIYLLNMKDKRLQAYSAYLTLKPIENLLHKRQLLYHTPSLCG